MGVVKGFKPLKSFSISKTLNVLFLGALGCAIYYLCLYYGYVHGRSIEVLVLQYSWPLQIILLSVVILRERLSMISLGAIALGFVGILVVLTKGNLTDIQFSTPAVSVIVLAGAFCFALFSVLSKRLDAEPFATTTLLFAGGTIVSIVSLMLFSSFQLPSTSELIPVLVNGALINGASYIFWLMALKRIPASMAAVIVFLAPALSAIWIVVFFGEVFYPAYGLGFVLVLIAGIVCVKNNEVPA